MILLSTGKFGVVHKGNLLTDEGYHKVVAIKTIKCKILSQCTDSFFHIVSWCSWQFRCHKRFDDRVNHNEDISSSQCVTITGSVYWLWWWRCAENSHSFYGQWRFKKLSEKQSCGTKQYTWISRGNIAIHTYNYLLNCTYVALQYSYITAIIMWPNLPKWILNVYSFKTHFSAPFDM